MRPSQAYTTEGVAFYTTDRGRPVVVMTDGEAYGLDTVDGERQVSIYGNLPRIAEPPFPTPHQTVGNIPDNALAEDFSDTVTDIIVMCRLAPVAVLARNAESMAIKMRERFFLLHVIKTEYHRRRTGGSGSGEHRETTGGGGADPAVSGIGGR